MHVHVSALGVTDIISSCPLVRSSCRSLCMALTISAQFYHGPHLLSLTRHTHSVSVSQSHTAEQSEDIHDT